MPEYPLLTDSQCRKFLKDMKEFGYPGLTFTEVRKIADEIYAGHVNPKNALAVIMLKEIEDAMEAVKKR